MELFFDTYEEHRHAGTVVNAAGSDVRLLTRRVVDLMEINPKTHAPPLILFIWGDPGVRGVTFRGVLARVNQRFTMFLPSGVPVRAQLEITIHECTSGVTEAKEVKRQSSDHSRVRQVAQGETLAAIAHEAYGDPRKWRAYGHRQRPGLPAPAGGGDRSHPAAVALPGPRHRRGAPVTTATGSQYVPDFELALGGQPVPADLRTRVMSVRFEEALEGANRVEVELANPDLRLLDQPLLDMETQLDLSLGYQSAVIRHVFKGTVTGMEPAFPSTGMPTIR